MKLYSVTVTLTFSIDADSEEKARSKAIAYYDLLGGLPTVDIDVAEEAPQDD